LSSRRVRVAVVGVAAAVVIAEAVAATRTVARDVGDHPLVAPSTGASSPAYHRLVAGRT